MSSNKVVHALYNDDDIVMEAVKKVRAAHHHVEEVFCPFPVHGLDKAMGLAPTRLAICAFIPVGNAAISALGKGVAR